jgi:Kef-type K+ transport system membrane component KefB
MNVYYVLAIWIGMALVASMLSIRIGISVALVEILVGAIIGNIPGIKEHVQQTDYTTLLAGVGSVLLTFLAGAEIDPVSLRRHWKASLSIGMASFALPLIGAFCFSKYVFGWNLHASEIAGVALSTTSVAVVYAVMVETGLNRHDIGKLILAACFVTDLGTVLALGGLFANFGWLLLLFVVVTAAVLFMLPRTLRWVIANMGHRVSEPEVKVILVVLLALGGLATAAGSEAVLPAYVAGLVVAGVFMNDRVVLDRIRTIAFALLTPFFFLRAGTLISASALVTGAGVIGALFLVKMVTKLLGVWPTAKAFHVPKRERTYTTLLMATGLTFGSIAALYGLTNNLITETQYTELVTVVILSAFLPTLIAQQFFRPIVDVRTEDREALGEEDISLRRRRDRHPEASAEDQ